ncbi:MAG TPA: phytanoyl-CoA dioxygenase family protein [Planctomycetota bacterium]|jgi:ectoine hydroxylase-related dioxygenase (phytanoyl-CoA dioxygenase family)|nr:phytanoyl-CoA dioxygenase family protein [Planctomycetota bacterium]
MNSTFTADEIKSYRENGFIVKNDFLTPAELQEWRDAVDEAVAARKNRKLANKEWEAGNDYYDNVFTQRLNLWMDNARMKKIMVDERLGKMAADLEGVDGMRIWHDQALIKEPWANPTAWHLDNPYWSYYSKNACSIWVALDDATYDNGCLYFLPGSHKTATFNNSGIGTNMADLFKIYPDWKTIKAVAAPMKAGSCSFHNGICAHGAHANMTPGRRRAMTCGYMPEGSVFNGQKNVLPDDYFNSLKKGDVLDNDAQNPLLYSKTKKAVTA